MRACVLPLCLQRQRADFWRALERGGARHASAAPVLLLHSADDALAPVADVARFGATLAARGRRVTAVRWESSPHVGHLRAHPERYEAAAAAWLADAVAAWRDAQQHARAEAPTPLTARL
jgi:farnesol dehydrogenase